MASHDVRQSLLLTSEQLGDLSSQFDSVSTDLLLLTVHKCKSRYLTENILANFAGR